MRNINAIMSLLIRGQLRRKLQIKKDIKCFYLNKHLTHFNNRRRKVENKHLPVFIFEDVHYELYSYYEVCSLYLLYCIV